MSCRIHAADEANIREAVRRLKRGEVIGAPTETVYGLFADASNPQALRRLKEIKGRAFDKPLQVMVPTALWAKDVAVLSPAAQKLADTFFPGPLTLVVYRKETKYVDEETAPAQDTIGIRIPDHTAVQKLLQAFEKPLAASSANEAGAESAVNADDAARALAAHDIFMLAGEGRIGRGSSVVDMTGKEPKLLREGSLSLKEIHAALNAR